MLDYMTKQRKRLLDFLKNHTDRQLTVKEIYQNLQQEGISQSAIYRNLAYLETVGAVRKSAAEGRRENVYQFLASEDCAHCLHLSCTVCGEICHLQDSQAAAFEKNLVLSDNFLVDRKKTVIYGKCNKCQEA